jgi:1-phosphofructokinase
MNNGRIRTLTLNPAVDRTVEIEGFAINQVNRIRSSQLDAGGKGINVSKSIHGFGGTSIAFGIIAGTSGNFITTYLDERGIEHRFIAIDGETRTNIKIVDPLNHTHTDINDQGPLISEKALTALEAILFAEVSPETIFVFSGSIGRGTPQDIYRRFILKARSLGARTILDADGEALRLGLEAGPTLVKPNIDEMERLFARSFRTGQQAQLDEIAGACKTLLAKGIELVVVSLGSQGALLVHEKTVLVAEGIPVQAKSTVGAGDAMVAALALSLQKGDPLRNMLCCAVAAGTAAVTTEGTAIPAQETLEHYREQVQVYEL